MPQLTAERQMPEGSVTDRPAGRKATAVLWFIAGALAWIAAIIRYSRGHEVKWTLAFAGLFCVAVGITALRRSRAADDHNRPRG